MNKTLQKILESNQVIDNTGEVHTLNSSVDEQEINFLQNLIAENNFSRSIEIGCAMGISSIGICESIYANDSVHGSHIIVDPFQSTEWKNIGINNVAAAGYKNYTLYEERSEFLLPRLASDAIQLDFAFIDGWHTFDHTLIDFFYLNRMLSVGGIIVIDDVGMLSINKFVRYIHNYPCYQYEGSVTNISSKSRRMFETGKSFIKPISKLFGQRLSREFFSPQFLESDKSLGLDASMIAFKKISEDTRPWNWYENF